MRASSPLERPDLYVVARLLERLWRENEPMLKTRLQVACNVNYDVFRKYLNWMSDRDLVRMEDSLDGHERVVLTQKGHEAYGRLVKWVNEVIHRKSP